MLLWVEGEGKAGFFAPTTTISVGSSQHCPPLAFGKRDGKEQKLVPGTSSFKRRAEERNKARGKTVFRQ